MAALSTIALVAGTALAAKQALSKPKMPDQPQQALDKAVDPAVEQAAADAKATANANAAAAAKNKARKASSLLAAGDPANQATASSALSYGKATLGQ